MQAVVVNCSKGYYNLGAQKLGAWLVEQGWTVEHVSGDPGLFLPPADLYALSVTFSWHAPLARDVALRVKDRAEVWAGGPGLFALGKWWRDETGRPAVRGLDPRFELQRGNYRMAFASRGCPVNCSFCIVPRLEGTAFTLDWEFEPAPILCDNNLSALPVEFQEHIIRRYQASGVVLQDANSGFEPRTFDEGTYRRWGAILRGPWRFAFDTLDEGQFVEPMMRVLRDVPARRKRVYCLIGNEPMVACYERAQKIIEWGGEPYVQRLMPLNALDRHQYKVAFDWTPTLLGDFARYYNRFIWRKVPIVAYQNRRHEAPPFAEALN